MMGKQFNVSIAPSTLRPVPCPVLFNESHEDGHSNRPKDEAGHTERRDSTEHAEEHQQWVQPRT